MRNATLNSATFYELFGKFCVEFEIVCGEMEYCADDLLALSGLNNMSMRKVVLSNLTAYPLQNMLRALLAEHFKSKECFEQYEPILSMAFNEFSELNETRNKLVHAKWLAPIDEEQFSKPKPYVLSQKLKTNKTGDGTEFLKYEEGHFQTHIGECLRLKEIFSRLRYLCAFPDLVNKYFDVTGKKLTLNR